MLTIPPDMSINEIAASASALLAPLLPYLVSSLSGAVITRAGEKAAGKAVEKIGEKIGEGLWERAKHLWGKFRPKIEQSDETQKALVKLADRLEEKPQEAEKVTNALEFELERLLEADPELTQNIATLIKATQSEYNDGKFFSIHDQRAQKIVNQLADKIVNADRIDVVNM